MACVAITRNGYGEVWEFEDRVLADQHPLVQYGDAILDEAADICIQYNIFDVEMLLRIIGNDSLIDLVSGSINDAKSKSRSHQSEVMATISEPIFDCLVAAAQTVPDDPKEIFDLIVNDRQKHRKERTMSTKEKAKTETKDAKAPKEKKIAGHPMSTKIVMGKDKEGNNYGPKNNPKRSGSATAARFELYKSGMTFQKAIDDGVEAGDISYDLGKGFIEISA